MPTNSWQQRLGVQTIIWGEEFEEGLDDVLRLISELGFRGVEFAQVPAKLGDPDEFERLMQKHGLTLLGLAGGSLETRLKFCRRLRQIKPSYLYVQELDENATRTALEEGYALALHPHHDTPLENSTRACQEIQRLHLEGISLLPDTAHLYLAGESLSEVIREHEDEIRVIHLKDWTPEFGSSIYTYARGFTELGLGVVAPDRGMLKEWLAADPERWIVLEQDHTQRRVSQSLRISIGWFSESRMDSVDFSGGFSRRRYPRGGTLDSWLPVLPESRPIDHYRRTALQLVRLSQFTREVSLDSFRDTEILYQTVLECFADIVNCKCASLWEVNPRADTATLRAFWRPAAHAKILPEIKIISLKRALSGLAIEERAAKYYQNIANDIHDSNTVVRSFADSKFIHDFALKGMLTIPISNYWNINQPEIVINLFPEADSDVLSAAALTMQPADPNPAKQIQPGVFDEDDLAPFLRFALRNLKEHVATTVERAWDGSRTQVVNEVNWIARSTLALDVFLQRLIDNIKKRLRCTYVGIYLEDLSGLSITLRAPREPRAEAQSVKPNDGIVGKVWANKLIENSGVIENKPANSSSYLLMPINPKGPVFKREAIGVIFCKDKHPSSTPSGDFTMADEMNLDAYQMAMTPFVERMLASESRKVSMRRISHELKGPLTVIRGASKYAVNEMATRGIRLSDDYLGQIRSYVGLMEQIVAKAGFLRIEAGIRLHRTRVLLFDDIVRPMIACLDDYLDERNFSKDSIDVSRTKDTRHALFLDKPRFQQVVFNLLSNAVKYAYDDPKSFRVVVEAQAKAPDVCLIFRDWGTGIPQGMEEAIFREGVRGPNAARVHAPGDGLGLWLVREIVRAHSGEIRVTPASQGPPTTFTITLPGGAMIPTFEKAEELNY